MTFLTRYFSKKQQPKIEVVRIQSSDLTLAQWRSDDKNIAAMQILWDNATFRLVLDVLRNEHPSKGYLLPSAGIEARGLKQARCEGFQQALDIMRQMKERPANKQDIAETFSPENALPIPPKKR